jgi:hypothetical protein
MKKMQLVALLFTIFSVCGAHNTWWGPTGVIQMPTPGILRPQQGAAHINMSFAGDDHYMGMNASYTLNDQMEVAFSETSGLKMRSGDSITMAFKYVPVANFAVGTMFDFHNDFKHTAYAVLGAPSSNVYMGLGANFGSGRYALLGNYSPTDRDMESIFFMAGAKMDLSEFYPSLEASVDFNGESMAVGLGMITKTNLDVELDYKSSGDVFGDSQFVVSVGRKF